MLANSRVCADIAVRELGAARRFYENVLGLAVDYEDADRGIYYRAGGGTMINLYQRDVDPGEQAVATFLVDDIDTAMRGLRDCGVPFTDYDEPDLKTRDGVFEDGTGFRVAWFKDAAGNVLSLEQLATG